MAENFVNILREIRGNTLAPATDTDCIYGDIKWMYGVISGYRQITPEERLKLEMIEEEATKNSTDAFLLSRANHTGVISMTSDEVPEGVVNKYFTEDRVTDRVKDFIKAGTNVAVSYDSTTNELTISANDTSVEWSEIQNKPSPNISVEITGDASGSANTTLTELASGSIEINNLTLKNTGTAGTYRSVTTDAQGRVIAGTNPTTLSGYGITDATPSSHIGSTGTAHDVVTTSVNGFMSSTDKSKLDDIAAGAQVNVATDLSLGAATATTIPLNSSTGADVILPAVTTTTAGLMGSADKTKLDGIEAGATGDQTAAEIKTAYESNNNTNALTDTLLALLTT